MRRYLTKAKTLFSHSQSISKRLFHNSAINYAQDKAWEAMDERDRINSALSDNNPATAEMAFYKALGFTRLGGEHTEEAIYFFEKAASMEPEHYEVPAKYYLAKIYVSMGQVEKAYHLILEAFNEMRSQLPESEYKLLFSQNIVTNEPHNSESNSQTIQITK